MEAKREGGKEREREKAGRNRGAPVKVLLVANSGSLNQRYSRYRET